MRPDPASVDGVAVELTARPRGVLLCLLLNPNRPVPVSKIVDFIWGEAPPRTASNSVARFVADLRRALGAVRHRIETVPGGYKVVVEASELDVETLDRLSADAARLAVIDPDRAHRLLAEALDLAGTEINDGLIESMAGAGVSRVHEELRISLLDRFAELQLRRAKHRELVADLERAVERHPHHEALWSKLIVALARSGRPTEALRAAQRARNSLAEVGVEPGAELLAIEADVAAGGRGLQLTPQRQVRAPSQLASEYGIPEPSNELLGRARELATVDRLLQSNRTVSIIGLGGSGKTRLAVAAARSLERAGSTVYRVGLRSVQSDEQVAPTVGAVIGVPPPLCVDADSLAKAVVREEFVLVLDNCEHVTAGCQALLAALAQVPGVRVLATSRDAVGADGEVSVTLGMLAVPDAGNDDADNAAVAMFADRAEDALRDESAGRATLRDVCSVVRSLRGHPLAIELAAAQLRLMSLRDLRASVGDGSEESVADPAVRALTDMLDWAWAGLEPGTQTLLARASTFGSGFGLAALETVCAEGDSLAVRLDQLIDAGLVTTHEASGSLRYELLEPVRQFAAERLRDRNEETVLLDRLVAWLHASTEPWTVAELHVVAAASGHLAVEHGNFVTGLSYLQQSGRIDEMAWLAVRASGMWINHGFAEEVRRWLGPVAADESLPRATRSAAEAMLLAAAHAMGRLDELVGHGLASLELADGESHDWLPAVASFMAMWSMLGGAPGSTDDYLELASSIATASASPVTNMAIAQLYRAHVDFGLRRYVAAADGFAACRGAVEHDGRLMMVAEAGHALSCAMAGDAERAVASLDSWRSEPDTDAWHYIVDVFRAVVLGLVGRTDEATSLLATAVRRLPAASVWGRSDEIQSAFGVLAGLRGESRLSEELLGTVTTRDVLLLAVVIEHVAAARGTTDDVGWFAVAQEYFDRVLPDQVTPEGVNSTGDLVSWWTSGSTAGAV